MALLFFATTINYLDRQVIGLLKDNLSADFGWSEIDYSRIVMAFSAAYALSLLVFGRMIDVLGTKTGYAVSVVIWSVAAMAHAVATTTGGFMMARVSLGLGEGGNFPPPSRLWQNGFRAKNGHLQQEFLIAEQISRPY